MPRSHGIIHVTVWEVGSDFRALTLDTQWAYEMLISQPQINNLGLLPYTPEKWWRFANDLTAGRLTTALETLEDERMTVTDPSTGELLVRTFVKHDRIWKHPKLVTNARKLIREVESERIRSHLLEAHPWLTEDGWSHTKIEAHETGKKLVRRPVAKPQTEPQTDGQLDGEPTPDQIGEPDGVPDGEHEPQPERVTDGEHDGVSPPRARVRDALPQDQGLGQDQPLPPLSTTKAVVVPTHGARAERTAQDQLTHISTTITDGLRHRGAP